LKALAAEGIAILLSEQRAGLALRVASRGVVLSRGRIVRQAPADELFADPALPDVMAGA
jgi:branched-chain amino acid transport system ATP-binding protein